MTECESDDAAVRRIADAIYGEYFVEGAYGSYPEAVRIARTVVALTPVIVCLK